MRSGLESGLPRILLLTDRTQLPPGADLVDTVGRCAEAGLKALILRELDLAEAARVALAHEINRRIRDHDVMVISARRWLPGADGVHLSSAQSPRDVAPARFYGRSCHASDEVRRAAIDGAAYLTVSPVAATESKPGYGPPLGADGVRRLTDVALGIPVFALGGVTPDNVRAMRRAGAHGVAVMGGVMRSHNPVETFRRLQEGAET
ncbi:thiamine phosphate synthase [Actinopolymorpha sp. B11F2]|uniref:thiamine phosphate synthase n=1 Tax=Actinopolymorpha sp. B11F2 TaxID=3160862 RepID=UPI0032E39136